MRFFHKKIKPRIITMSEHNAWGNSIYFYDYKHMKVAGHMTPVPKVGDILRAEMKSGQIARFKVDKVTVMRNPSDQFFATVSPMYYE